jgi:hypothetical protein
MDAELPGGCQLVQLDETSGAAGRLKVEPWWWALKRHGHNLAFRLRTRLRGPGPVARRRPDLPASDLRAGERVRVRSRAEIAATLDEAGTCSGCWLAPPQYECCGREFTVARRVERFFDERRWRMLRTRNLVALEGVRCDGRGLPETAGCDRGCYYFWRTEWLERVT